MPSLEDEIRAQNLTVLVVEDEALVALNLEDMLGDLGCTVVGPAMKYEAAIDLLERGVTADLAILDVNIGGKPVYPIAERLAERRMPIVFATGYGRSGLPDSWRAWPVLQKPYAVRDLEECLAEAARRKADSDA